jgi:hypothetical protein
MERNHTPMKNLNTSLVKTKTMTRRMPPAEADLEERAEALAGLALHGGRSGLASYGHTQVSVCACVCSVCCACTCCARFRSVLFSTIHPKRGRNHS